MNNSEVVIVSAARTAIGTYGGSFKDVRATGINIGDVIDYCGKLCQSSVDYGLVEKKER